VRDFFLYLGKKQCALLGLVIII